MGIRKPIAAGSFYPKPKDELEAQVSRCFQDQEFGPGGIFEENPKILGGLAPHAGLAYSGPCAATLFARIPKTRYSTIVLLGTNHTGLGTPLGISPSEFWETPLGKVPVNSSLAERLSDSVFGLFSLDSFSHAKEHSIEVELPFLQTHLEKEFSILPISVSEGNLDTLEQAAALLAKSVDRKRTFFLASSDFNHYEDERTTLEKDSSAIDATLSLSAERLLGAVENKGISMCGVLPVALLLLTMANLGAKEGRLLSHYTSGKISGDASRGVVGYASIEFL